MSGLRAFLFKRKIAKSIKVLRYVDRLLRYTGMSRHKVKQMWQDFFNHNYVRSMIFNQLATANKIKIRKEYELKVERQLGMVQASFHKVSRDLAQEKLKRQDEWLLIPFLEDLVSYYDLTGVNIVALNGILEDYGITIDDVQPSPVIAGITSPALKEAMDKVIEKSREEARREVPTVQS